jgi:hypothetical protein
LSILLTRLLVFSACLVVPSLAETIPPSSRQTLTIFVKGAPSGMAVIRGEVARLMEPVGFDVEWKDFSDRRSGEDFAQLARVDFNGSCEVNTAPPSRSTDASLASTAVSDGQVLPFAVVQCDTLRRVMNSALSSTPREVRQAMFGRAAARVLAHELFHMLAQTKSHGSHGVSKSCFAVKDLTAEGFRFDEQTVAQIRSQQTVSWFEETITDDFSGR